MPMNKLTTTIVIVSNQKHLQKLVSLFVQMVDFFLYLNLFENLPMPSISTMEPQKKEINVISDSWSEGLAQPRLWNVILCKQA